MTSPVEAIRVETTPAKRLRPGCALIFVFLLVALGSLPGVAIYWEQVRRSQGVHVLAQVHEGVRNVAFVGSAELALLRGDGTVARFTLEGKRTNARPWGGVDGSVLEVLPGAKTAIVGGNPLLLVDLEDGTNLGHWGSPVLSPRNFWRRPGTDADGPHRAAVAADGVHALLAGPSDPTGATTDVTVINLGRKKATGTITLLADPCAVAVSPDGKSAVVFTEAGTVELCDLKAKTQTRTLSNSGGYRNSENRVVWAPDGKHVVVTDYTGVAVWDTTTWASTAIAGGVRYEIYGLAVSPDGQFAATITAGHPNRVQVYDVTKATQILEARVPGRTPTAIVFAPDGRSIVGVSEVRGGEGVLFRVDLDEAAK